MGSPWIDEYELEVECEDEDDRSVVDDFGSSTPYLHIHASTSISSSPPTASIHTFYLPKNLLYRSTVFILFFGIRRWGERPSWDVIVGVILRCVNTFSFR